MSVELFLCFYYPAKSGRADVSCYEGVCCTRYRLQAFFFSHRCLALAFLSFLLLDERICSPPFTVLDTDCSSGVLEQIKRQGLTFPFSKLFSLQQLCVERKVTLLIIYIYFFFNSLPSPFCTPQFAKHGWPMEPTPTR